MKKKINFYLGEEKLNGFSSYFLEENFFLIIEIKENFNKEKGYRLINELKQISIDERINNLYQLDEFINQFIIDNNLPTSLSLAAIIFKDNVVYLKTINEGVIFLKRKNKVVEIISKNQNASGYIEVGDLFVLTTFSFVNKLKDFFDIKNILIKKEPKDFIFEITPFLKNNNDDGLVALLIKIEKEETKSEDYFSFLRDKNFLSFFNQQINQKKTLTYLFVLVIFFIFVWSVILGYQRRKEVEINNRVQKTRNIIFSKLEEAEQIAFFNLYKASQLINEAKKEIDFLKKDLNIKNKKIDEIEEIIYRKENEIMKKEIKNYKEFYDLTVDRKEAKGDKFFLQNELLFVLDKNGGIIYSLSLEKKSLKKYSHQKVKKASLIASYNEKIYFFVADEGIFQFIDKDKIQMVIEKDSDWGEIKDISTYNGNIYLLDIKNDEIYKYVPSNSGFSLKTSYFQTGEAINLQGANSLSIDSSIYIGFSKSIFKFTKGIKEDFKNHFSNKYLSIKKIYTDKELNKVYLFDKDNGLIYILNKNGDYQQQIFSEIIKKASDFVVYKEKIFLLLKNKIYTIE